MQSVYCVFHLFIKENVTVVMFESATLHCRMKGIVTAKMNWRFVEPGKEEDKLIYANSKVVDAFKDSIYTIRNKDGRHELFIPNTTSMNAGDYYCLDRSEIHVVHLIVLGKNSFCYVIYFLQYNNLINFFHFKQLFQ